MGNINLEETIEDGLDGKKGSSGMECCLSKIEKLAVSARVALLQSTNSLVGDLGASVHCTNDGHRGSDIHKRANGKARLLVT